MLISLKIYAEQTKLFNVRRLLPLPRLPQPPPHDADDDEKYIRFFSISYFLLYSSLEIVNESNYPLQVMFTCVRCVLYSQFTTGHIKP